MADDASGGKTAPRRGLLQGTTLGAGVLLVAALLLLVNYFGWKYWKRFDWTSSKIYSLSDKSKGVLKELDRDVEVVVFMTPGSQLYVPATELLARYEAASSRIKVRTLDPERNPAEARRLLEQFNVKNMNNVVFSTGPNERRVIEEADLAEYDYSGMQMGQAPQIREFKGEQVFTGAILEMVEKKKPKILFTTGHGEAAPDDNSPRGLSQAQDLVGRDNFEVSTWKTLGASEVPAGTDLVVVAGPQVAFLEPELQALTRFLVGGGRVLLLLDPVLGKGGLERSGFGPWLEGYGVKLGDDIVVDPTNPLPFYSAETFFANQYEAHPITAALEDANYPVIFSLARSVGTLPNDGDAKMKVTQLVKTSPDAWGETNLAKLDAVAKDDADVPGPVGLGVAVELESGAGAGAKNDGSLTVLDDDGGGENGVEENEDGAASPGAAAKAASDQPPPAAGMTAMGPQSPQESPAKSDEDAQESSATAPAPAAAPGAPPAEAAPPPTGAAASSGASGASSAAAEAKPRPGRLVVFGDSDFATNAQLASVGNPTLLLNAMNWLVERQNLLAIPPKKADQIQLNLTRRDLGTIYLIVLVALPLASLSAGVGVYLRRRR